MEQKYDRRAPEGRWPPADGVGETGEDQDARDLGEAGEQWPDKEHVPCDPWHLWTIGHPGTR